MTENPQPMPESMIPPVPGEAQARAFPILLFRETRQMTLNELARRIGLKSKGQMSLLERGLRMPTPEQALAIEELSEGLIDASTLNPIIAKARGVEWGGAHAAADSAAVAGVSPGNDAQCFPSVASDIPEAAE